MATEVAPILEREDFPYMNSQNNKPKSYTLKVIWLYVNPENKRAVNLYQNNGFKFVNLIKLPDTPLQKKMIKKIN